MERSIDSGEKLHYHAFFQVEHPVYSLQCASGRRISTHVCTLTIHKIVRHKAPSSMKTNSLGFALSLRRIMYFIQSALSLRNVFTMLKSNLSDSSDNYYMTEIVEAILLILQMRFARTNVLARICAYSSVGEREIYSAKKIMTLCRNATLTRPWISRRSNMRPMNLVESRSCP